MKLRFDISSFYLLLLNIVFKINKCVLLKCTLLFGFTKPSLRKNRLILIYEIQFNIITNISLYFNVLGSSVFNLVFLQCISA